jgi:hypothetical protein
VDKGKPVKLVATPEVGVPSNGVTNVGEVDNTTLPVPVEVVTPVPPLSTGKAVPLYEIANVPDVVMGDPVTDKNEGTVAATEVTVPPPPPEPLAAAVIRPWASMVMLAAVYVPAVTAVFAKAIVPVVVIGPPVRPVPVATEVTVPEPPPPVAAIV